MEFNRAEPGIFRETCVNIIPVGALSTFVARTPIVNARRLRRNGNVEIVTTIREPPYVSEVEGATGNDRYEGYIPDLMKKIAQKANIQYEFRLVPDGRYGKEESGSWNGMIGQVLDSEARFAAAPMTISDARRAVVDFTEPIMDISSTILIKKPSHGKPPIRDAQGLADQTKIKYGVVDHGVTHNFFETSNDPTIAKMWNYMSSTQGSFVLTNKAGVQRVLDSDGEFAFIMENSTAEYWTNKKPCELMTVGGNLGAQMSQYAFALRKNDGAMKSKLDSAITELKNSGDLKRLERKWWPNATCGASALSTAFLSVLPLAFLARYIF